MFAYQLSTTDLREGICEAEKLSRFIDYLVREASLSLYSTGCFPNYRVCPLTRKAANLFIRTKKNSRRTEFMVDKYGRLFIVLAEVTSDGNAVHCIEDLDIYNSPRDVLGFWITRCGFRTFSRFWNTDTLSV